MNFPNHQNSAGQVERAMEESPSVESFGCQRWREFALKNLYEIRGSD